MDRVKHTYEFETAFFISQIRHLITYFRLCTKEMQDHFLCYSVFWIFLFINDILYALFQQLVMKHMKINHLWHVFLSIDIIGKLF